MKAHRPTIMGTRHMIAATQYLAAEAGFRILEAGGNAIDAGVACGIALGVVQPEFVNVAGVAPIIIYSAADDRVFTIPGLGPGPRRLRAITSRSITAARFRRASCGRWCRRRPMPGSPRSSASAP
jgi:gamma-glutamyltranspeptidase